MKRARQVARAQNKTLHEVSGSPFPAGEGAAALAIDITASYLFVAGHESNDVSVFQIDDEAGTLTLLGHTSLQSAGPSALAMDPSGQYLYVTNDKTGGVTTLQLDVSTGTLTGGAGTKGTGRASSILVTTSSMATRAP